MILMEEPYFKQNKEWYYEDETGTYIVKDDAPKEAINSYNAYNEILYSRKKPNESDEEYEKRLERLTKIAFRNENDEKEQVKKIYGF